jgi:3-deoxy-manno-octulosonate cytidylyltransferase (CMP-KDO synthetase)
MQFKIVIPARFASTRLPGKPLLMIAGKPMIQHVFERARQSGAGEIVVATDDKRIAEVASGFGAEVCMTAPTHSSGTERIAEVVRRLNWAPQTIVVNLQGDEPGMPATLISQVALDMDRHPDAQMTTLSAPITERDRLFDPHVVKVVTNERGYALYFSRAPIPWHRDEFVHQDRPLPDGVGFSRHIGLYAYRAGFLEKYVNWPPTPLEKAESLEQLRVLAHGDLIHVSQAHEEPGHGVDTMDDLQRVEEEFRR